MEANAAAVSHTDAILSDSGATPPELRAAVLAERAAWEVTVDKLHVTLAKTTAILDNVRQQNVLLAASNAELTTQLVSITPDWETAEQGWARAASPGLFRRLEISAPLTALGFVAGLAFGLVAGS